MDINNSRTDSSTRKIWIIRDRRQQQKIPVEGVLTTIGTPAAAGTPAIAETTTTTGIQRTPMAAITSPTAESTAIKKVCFSYVGLF
jgi:hypothetical protein